MRNILTIAIIGLYSFTNTEIAQVFKWPQLVRHYRMHQSLNPSVTFGHFLYMHYAGDDGTTADDNEDVQLPFHSVNKHCISSLYYLPGLETYSLEEIKTERTKIYTCRTQPNILSRPGNLIFEPPRYN